MRFCNWLNETTSLPRVRDELQRGLPHAVLQRLEAHAQVLSVNAIRLLQAPDSELCALAQAAALQRSVLVHVHDQLLEDLRTLQLVSQHFARVAQELRDDLVLKRLAQASENIHGQAQASGRRPRHILRRDYAREFRSAVCNTLQNLQPQILF